MKRRILKKLAKKLLTMPEELKGDSDEKIVKEWAEIVAKVIPELKGPDVKEVIDTLANMLMPKIEQLLQTQK